MNAQEMLLNYANEKNTGNLTAQQFIGQAITEGIVIERGPDSMVVAKVRREGKTIILTETTKEFGKETGTVEIFRVNV